MGKAKMRRRHRVEHTKAFAAYLALVLSSDDELQRRGHDLDWRHRAMRSTLLGTLQNLREAISRRGEEVVDVRP